MAFVKPTLPPFPQNIQKGGNYATVWTVLNVITVYFQSLVVYLQTYLSSVYDWTVPLKFGVVIVSPSYSPYAVAETDTFIAASASASAATIVALPDATGSGRVLVVKKMDANAHDITVTSPNLIDGASSLAITTQYGVRRIADSGVGIWSLF